MSRYSICIHVVCLALLTGWALACSSSDPLQKPDRPGFNYNQYRTYAIANPVPTSPENPAFRWLQLSDRIRNELEYVMPSVGLDRSSNNPDLRIYVYVIAEEDEQRPLVPYQIGWRAEPFLARDGLLAEYPSNTLVLDFVDTNLNELVWRGSASLPLEDQSESYKALSGQIKKIVRRYPNLPPQE